MPTEFETLRAQAVDGTHLPLSKNLLESFPRLVANPGISPRTDLHYQDYDLRGAIACTAAEANILDHLAFYAGPKYAVEIGSATGWSTAHIAQSCNLVCIDPFTEVKPRIDGLNPAMRFWENIEACGLDNKVELIRLPSPEALDHLSDQVDFAFVDGHHGDGQPLRDAQGLLHHLTDHALVVWHDSELRDVREAITFMQRDGWVSRGLLTSNWLVVMWRRGRQPDWWEMVVKLVNGKGLLMEAP